jgi:hypothetical protein
VLAGAPATALALATARDEEVGAAAGMDMLDQNVARLNRRLRRHVAPMKGGLNG